MAIKRQHLIISGRVQGVSYRASACEMANRLAINGWVRNLPDGQVEMLIQGEDLHVDQMIQWAQQGPRFADVSNVVVTEHSPADDFNSFSIR